MGLGDGARRPFVGWGRDNPAGVVWALQIPLKCCSELPNYYSCPYPSIGVPYTNVDTGETSAKREIPFGALQDTLTDFLLNNLGVGYTLDELAHLITFDVVRHGNFDPENPRDMSLYIEAAEALGGMRSYIKQALTASVEDEDDPIQKTELSGSIGTVYYISEDTDMEVTEYRPLAPVKEHYRARAERYGAGGDDDLQGAEPVESEQ